MPFPQLLPLTASSTSEVTCLDIFLRDPTAFNEEVCESSLSHLARAATSRPNLRYYDAANKTYKRLGLFTAAVNTLNQEMTNHLTRLVVRILTFNRIVQNSNLCLHGK